MNLKINQSKEKNEFLDYWNLMYEDKNIFGTGETKLAKYAHDILKKKSVKKILEIGCGQGRDSIFFSQLGYNVNSFDISSNAINFLNDVKKELRIKNLNIKIYDTLNPFDYPSESFDFVYSNLALQFFNIQELEKIFDNIHKVMKKDSSFLFSTKKVGDKYYQFGTKINENAFSYKGITRYFFDENVLRKLLSEKFDILEFTFDEHTNLNETVSLWWKILVNKKQY